jgi:hypothetical protein
MFSLNILCLFNALRHIYKTKLKPREERMTRIDKLRVFIEAILHSALPKFFPDNSSLGYRKPAIRTPRGNCRTHGHNDSAILCMH